LSACEIVGLGTNPVHVIDSVFDEVCLCLSIRAR
jgi:hypothetical protein